MAYRYARPPKPVGQRRQRSGGGDSRLFNRVQNQKPKRPPQAGDKGWNPKGLYAKPMSVTPGKPAVPPPAWTPPPNPAFIQAQNVFNRNTGNIKAQYGTGVATDPFAQRYGFQGVQAQREFGFNDQGQIDVNNPTGRAYLLQEAYKQGQRGTSTSMAARGQLYSGALQNALGEGTRRFETSQADLRNQFSRTINDIDQTRLGLANQAQDALGDAQVDYANWVAAERPNHTTPGTPATGPTKTYHPIVRDTIAKAQKLWGSGQKKGKKWADIISILGYDPRTKNGLKIK